MAQQLKSQYEQRLIDHSNYVRLQINLYDVAFPSSYYDFMQKANTDLGIAGISGSIPSPEQGFLSYFNDDNRSGFTLDYGIDTTSANIPIAYRNASGHMVYELWSYNAIVSALNGKVFVKDGMEQTLWNTPQNLITAELIVSGEALDTLANETSIATLMVGDLNALALKLKVDSIESYVVTTTSGQDLLYILKRTSAGYELYQVHHLVKTVREAIQLDIPGYTLNTLSEQPLTLAEINAIPYIFTAFGGFNTMNDIWTEAKVPNGFDAYVYSTQFDNLPIDAYVVIKVGDYYIGWHWL